MLWLSICKSLFSRDAHGPITGLQIQSKKPYNKQLIQLECSLVTENLKAKPRRIDLTWSFSLRKSHGKKKKKIEQNIVKNPNWPEANQLAIYKFGRGFELGAVVKQSQLVVNAGVEPPLNTRPRCLLLRFEIFP